MKNTNTKKKLPTVEQLTCEGERSAMEDRAKAVEMSQALTKAEPKLEMVKNVAAGKMVTAARDASGKFGNRALAIANDNAKRIAKAAYMPDETGFTMVEQVIASQLLVAWGNKDPRNLNAVAGFIETLDEVTGQKLVRQKMSKEPDVKPPMKVEINVNINDSRVIDWDAKVKAEAERARKGPTFADGTVTQQNPPEGRDQI
jgi:hypothetical protein